MSSLIQKLKSIVGSDSVLTAPQDLEPYATDAGLDRAIPQAVTFPKNTKEVSELVRLCQKNHIPFTARGAGTNMCGSALPLKNAVVIVPNKMDQILSIDTEKQQAHVQPGVLNFTLNERLKTQGLFYAPDPASWETCTIGGNIATNAGGPHCLKYGVTSNHILGLEVVLPNGDILHTHVDSPGMDLTGLFVGSEGTLGIVTEATVNLLPIPQQVTTLLVAFSSLEKAMQAVTAIIASGVIPACLEALDQFTIQLIEQKMQSGYPQNAEAVLIIELDGNTDLSEEATQVQKLCQQHHALEIRIAHQKSEREQLWKGRRNVYHLLAQISPNVLVQDGTVPRHCLPQVAGQIRKLAKKFNIQTSLIFHAGDGNLHPQILFDRTDSDQTQRAKAAGEAMLKACVDLGGSISGEHGIGVEKREAMRWLFSQDTLDTFKKIKRTFDPHNLCNPDKLIPEKGSCRGGVCPPFQDKEKTLLLDHDIDNFTVTVNAEVPIIELQQELKKENQKMLLLEKGTVQEAIEQNWGQTPRIRDLILGMQVQLNDGSTPEFGGKVMKNVAGYNAISLFIGSEGKLGKILSVTLKTVSLKSKEEGKPVKRKKIPLTPLALEIQQKLIQHL